LQDAKFGTYTNKIREYFYRSEKSDSASSEETESKNNDNVEPIRKTVA
jgi:NitT/TauT family transport system ATP-binding protein